MKKAFIFTLLIGFAGILGSCDALKNLPTNTSGGIFSLNGNWRLVTSSDNNAQVGTVVTVTPAISSATVKSLSNNNYCYRNNDEAWRAITALSGGGFSISFLANACNGSTTYKDGQITIITNNQIRISTRTLGDIPLTQDYERVVN